MRFTISRGGKDPCRIAGLVGAVSVLILLAGPEVCALTPGTTGQEFLKIGIGARPTAMGDTFTGLADDADTLHWNPAGLSRIEEYQVSLMHNRWISDVNYESISYAQPVGFIGYAGVGVSYLSVPEFDNTVGREPSVSAQNFLLTGGFATRLRNWVQQDSILNPLAVGINLKIASFSVAHLGSSTDLAVDAGFLYPTPWKPLTFGLSLMNAGTAVGGGKSDPLPTSVRFGPAVRVGDGVLATDYVYTVDGTSKVGLGVEYTLLQTVILRGGVRDLTAPPTGLNGMTFGAGWQIRSYQLNYTFVPFGEIGTAHRFALQVSFEKELKEMRQILAQEARDNLIKERILMNFKSGMELYQKGDPEGAIDAWQKVLALDPDNVEAKAKINMARDVMDKRVVEQKLEQKYLAGMNAFKAGEYVQAVEEWNLVLTMNPNYLNTQDLVAQAKEKIAEKEGQQEQRKHQIDISLFAAKLALRTGRLYEAVAEWRKIQVIDPQHAAVQDALKQNAEAIAALSKKLSLEAEELTQKGETEKASVLWKKVLVLDPENAKAKQRLEGGGKGKKP